MLANKLDLWGYSSAGRALEWHSRGQRFDPAYLHQKHRMHGVFFDMRDFAILLRRSVAARTATRWRFALRVNSHASLLRKRLRGTLPTPRLSPPIGTHPHRWRFDWLGRVFFFNSNLFISIPIQQYFMSRKSTIDRYMPSMYANFCFDFVPNRWTLCSCRDTLWPSSR